jgi:hypothetical protein
MFLCEKPVSVERGELSGMLLKRTGKQKQVSAPNCAWQQDKRQKYQD